MITPALLQQVMPLSGRNADTFAPHLDAACKEWQIDSGARVAAFLAQLAHESGQLRWVAELASGETYTNRADLGNTKPEAVRIASAAGKSAGAYWKGHGLIQTTGFDNHLDVARYYEIPIEDVVAWLQTPEGASRSAGRFWYSKRLNELADAGLFETITRRINGGMNGLQERLAFWTAAKAAIGVSP